MAKNGFRVMDSDMHILEPPDLWQCYIAPEFRDIAPIGRVSGYVKDLGVAFPAGQLGDPRHSGFPAHGRFPAHGQSHDLDQARYKDHSQRGWGPDVQLEAMDVEGIDVAVLYPSRGLSVLTAPKMEPTFAAAVARAYNHWLYDFCQADATRLLGAGMISIYDIEDAVEEVRHAVLDFGFVAVFLRSNIVNGKPWHDPYYEPLWNVLEELEVPLGFHESSGSRSPQVGDRFDPDFVFRSVYAQPMEQMLGLGSFLLGGILERHPKLKVAFLEANCAWVPWLLWRLDEAHERFGDVLATELTMAPSAYFKRQCYVSIEPDETPARHMLEEFGSDQIVFSTDYPHVDSRYPEAVDAFLRLPLSDEDKRKILWDNCAQFYSGRVPVK